MSGWALNNARFSLMLINNVVEITLRQIGKAGKGSTYTGQGLEHADALADALGQYFDSKLKIANKLGGISEAKC